MEVFGQIVKLIPKKLIDKLKNKYKIQTRSFSATSHLVAMLYAQLSHTLSLNDICDCLRFHSGQLSQIRDCVPPSRNGLAHTNASRDSAMAEELFGTVLSEIKQKYPDFISRERHYSGFPWRFKRAIHIVDSTTIKLIAKCLDWAKHREQKAAAKMHLDSDLKSFLPNFAIVNRAKENICYEVMGQQLSEEEILQAKHMWENNIFMGQQPIVLSDCRIKMTANSLEKYPQELRLVSACV